MISECAQEAIRKTPNGAIVTNVLSKLGMFRIKKSKDELDELVSVGLCALIKAESSYNPDLGFSLSTHSYGKIRWAILDELRKPEGFYGRVVHARLRTMRKIKNLLSHRHFANPTRKQIAIEMGLLDQQVDVLFSAEASISDTNDIDLLTAENDGVSILELLEFESEMKLLWKKIAKLKPVERKIIHLYYVEELSSDKIAQKLGYSTSHLRNLKAQTQRKLRMKMRK